MGRGREEFFPSPRLGEMPCPAMSLDVLVLGTRKVFSQFCCKSEEEVWLHSIALLFNVYFPFIFRPQFLAGVKYFPDRFIIFQNYRHDKCFIENVRKVKKYSFPRK